jgi:hypothetical protein
MTKSTAKNGFVRRPFPKSRLDQHPTATGVPRMVRNQKIPAAVVKAH